MPTIQEDAPHPQSYRPDLPLRSEPPLELDALFELREENERLESRLDEAMYARHEAEREVEKREDDVTRLERRVNFAEDEASELRAQLEKLKGAA